MTAILPADPSPGIFDVVADLRSRMGLNAPPAPVIPAPRNGIDLGGNSAPGGGLSLGTAGYGAKALAQETAIVRGTRTGRNNQLNVSALKLGQLVAGGQLDEATVVAKLADAARFCGLEEREILPTILSGLGKGKLQPRTPPPRETLPTGIPLAPGMTGGGSPLASAIVVAEPEPAPAADPFAKTKARLRAALVDTFGLDNIPEPDPLIAGVAYRNSLLWLAGAPGNGKSFVATDMTGAIATGEPWQGRKTTQGGVMYLLAEGLTGMRQRVRAWERAMSGQMMTGVSWLPIAVQASAGDWIAMCELAAELEVAMFIIDTQARVTVGMSENDAKDMGVLVDRLEMLREATKALVTVIHHTGRSGDHMRGSTALEGAATTIIHVSKSDDRVTLKCQKQKDAPEFDPIELRLVPFDSSAILSPILDGTPASSDTPAVRAMLRLWWDRFETDPVSIKTLEDGQVVTRSTFYLHAKALENRGVIEASGKGNARKYRLPTKPDIA